MRSRRLRMAAWTLGVVAFLGAAGELLCRWGLVPNVAAELRRRAGLPAPRGRILILGDSFSVEANPGAQTLGNQLSQRFSARGLGVVNLSVSGYGPADELDALRLFQADASGYRPDILLVNYFVGNDLSDTLLRLKGGSSRVGLLRYRGGAWLQRSYLLRLVMGFVHEQEVQAEARRIRRTQMQLLLAAPLPAAREAVNPYLVDVARRLPDFLAINLLVEGKAAEFAWAENQRILRRMHEYAVAKGARMVINIFPHTLQVNDSHYRFFWELGFRMDPRMRDSTAPQDRLMAFCQAEGIVCNDLLPAFRRRAGDELYVLNDDHWVTAGHTLAADLIEQAVAPLLP